MLFYLFFLLFLLIENASLLNNKSELNPSLLWIYSSGTRNNNKSVLFVQPITECFIYAKLLVDGNWNKAAVVSVRRAHFD